MSLTVREAAAALEEATGQPWHEDTIRYLVRSGILERVPAPGRRVLIREDSLKPYLPKPKRRWWQRG